MARRLLITQAGHIDNARHYDGICRTARRIPDRESAMDLRRHGSFTVTGCELHVIPGTQYAFIRLALVEKPLQTQPAERRYVFSYGQLADLRDEIDTALRLFKEATESDPSLPSLH